jgi:hypothetical protein
MDQVAPMSAIPPKAEIDRRNCHVRFVPNADEVHRSKKTAHVHHAHRRRGDDVGDSNSCGLMFRTMA